MTNTPSSKHPSFAQVLCLAAASLVLAGAPAAQAQLAVSSNDRKVFLADDGSIQPTPPGGGDTVTVFDFSVAPPKIIAQIDDVPGSVIGPPSTLAISPDESLAVVASSMKRDPADPSKQVFDNRLTIIDLAAKPPVKLATIEAGQQPTGVAFSPDGRLVLVANRAEGTISTFRVDGKTLLSTGKLALGNDKAGPSAVAFLPDGKSALVTRNNDNIVSVLDIDGGKVTLADRHMGVTQAPYALAVNPDGKTAVFGSTGAQSGFSLDAGIITVVDTSAKPFKVSGVYAVAPVVENVVVSLDGAYVASISHNGSGMGKTNPLFNPFGILTVFKVEGNGLRKIAERKTGRWGQGAAFTKGNDLVVQNSYDKQLVVFHVQGDVVSEADTIIPMAVMPVALATANRR